VAFVVEAGDVAATGDLGALLVDRLGVETRRIVFADTTPADPDSVARTLAQCQACLVFWGTRAEPWVRDVLARPEIAALGKERVCVYAAPPASPEKATFRSTRAQTIVATASVDSANEVETALSRFLTTARPPA
jgi:hypothetical protein